MSRQIGMCDAVRRGGSGTGPFKAVPRHALVELTHRCNFRCLFCYADCGRSKSLGRGELSVSEWKEALDALFARGVKDITFSGGEPLLKEGFEELLEYAASNPYHPRISVYTNCSLVTERHLRLFKKHKIFLLFSLQGLETFKYHTRGGADVFSVLETVSRAQIKGVKTACGITVTRVNRYELRNMISAALLCGVKNIQVVPVVAEGRALKHPEILLDFDEMDTLVSDTRELSRMSGARITGRGEFFCSCVNDAVRPRGTPESYIPPHCETEKDSLSLDPTGFVHKCIHIPEGISYWRDFLSNFSVIPLDK